MRSEGQLRVVVIYTHLYVRLLSTMSRQYVALYPGKEPGYKARQYTHNCVLILNFQWLFIVYNIQEYFENYW